jgi:hypothetical protein
MGPGPVAPQAGEEPDHHHGMCSPRGPRARAEAGRAQGPGASFADEARQGAIGLVLVVVEGERLLSVSRIVRVIQVEHDGRRRLRVAGDAVGSQRLGQPREVLPVHAVCKARAGRRTCQSLLWSPRGALHTELKQRITPEAVSIIAVRLAGGDVIDTLGPEVAQGVINVGRMARIVDGGREACGEANLAIAAAA